MLKKEIWFIRHAESEANAGLPTQHPRTIPLTPLGHHQAELLSTKLDRRPDLFIVTPYLRTRQTAQPAIEKFPEVPVEVWELQEYDFLSHEQCIGTTVDQRKPWVTEFWNKCAPDYVHGKGAESFFDFQKRVADALHRLTKVDASFIVAFVHGHVIRALSQTMITSSNLSNQSAMAFFRDNMSRVPVNNTEIFQCYLFENTWQMNDSERISALIYGR